MCPNGTQCRQGSPDAPDATRCGAWVQDAQDTQDAESRIGESGRNTTVSDAGYLFADDWSRRGLGVGGEKPLCIKTQTKVRSVLAQGR